MNAKSTAGVTRLRPWSSAAACSGLRAASISKRSQVRASAQVAATEYSRKQRPKSSSAESAAPAQMSRSESSNKNHSSRREPRCQSRWTASSTANCVAASTMSRRPATTCAPCTIIASPSSPVQAH